MSAQRSDVSKSILDKIIQGASRSEGEAEFFEAPLDLIDLREDQPRKTFEGIEELAETIRKLGIIEPLVVKRKPDGRLLLVSGERRYRAAQLANLSRAPVRALDLDDHQMALIALVENLQREELNPFEEVRGVIHLISGLLGIAEEEAEGLLRKLYHSRTSEEVPADTKSQVDEVFRSLGINPKSWVQNKLALLRLPEDLVKALREGVPYSLIRRLATVKDPEKRKELLELVRAGELSRRELELRIREFKPREGEPTLVKETLSRFTRAVRKRPELLNDPEVKQALEVLRRKLGELK